MVDVTTKDVMMENVEANEDFLDSDNVEEWRKRITAMEAEVKVLENKVREDGDKLCIVHRNELDEMIKEYLSSPDTSGQTRHSVQQLQFDIENLDHMLELNKAQTNIELKKSTAVVVKEDASSVCHEHMLHGVCVNLPFTIKYTVQESKGVGNESAKVTELKVNVEAELLQGFEHVVARIQETNDIQGFFTFYRSLANQLKTRFETFREFRQEFNDCLKISTEGDKPHLVISNKSNDRESWRIYWDIVVTTLYRVIPKIYLVVELDASSGSKMDEAGKDLAVSIPDIFQNMLKEQGIESAVRDIIHLASESARMT